MLTERAGLPGQKLLALFERRILTAPFRLEEHAGPLAHLLEKYQDQGIQLADACLIRKSDLNRDCRIFTLEKQHFQLYRRFERQVIPLVAVD